MAGSSLHATEHAATGRSDVATLRQRVLDFLRRHHTMSLATYGPEGLWAAAVFYVNEGFDLYFQSHAATRHARNLVATRSVAATIAVDAEDWLAVNGLQLEGIVETVTARDERLQVLKGFLLRYPFVEGLWGGEKSGGAILLVETSHLVFRIRPHKLLFLDHEYAEGRLELAGDELTP